MASGTRDEEEPSLLEFRKDIKGILDGGFRMGFSLAASKGRWIS
jgi:hypothetical protein